MTARRGERPLAITRSKWLVGIRSPSNCAASITTLSPRLWASDVRAASRITQAHDTSLVQ
jgi:hypothetical protein